MSVKNSFNFPSVEKVEASAGSGKTYELAKHYVQLILNPNLKTEDIPLKSILAITFTNKASMEMKQRILEFIKRIAFDRFANNIQKNEILSSLAVKPAAAKKLAYEAMNEIIGNYDFFQVQTIDSFINTLLKGCAFYLDLAFDFRIKQNQHQYLIDSINRIIDKRQNNQEISNAFDEFLDYYLFAENKESWFSKRNIIEVVEILYNYSNIYGGSFRKPEIEAKDIIEKKKIIIGLIAEIQQNIPEETDKRFITSIDNFLGKYRDSFAVGNISAYFVHQEFPLKKGAKEKGAEVSEKIAELWAEVRKNLEELCAWESFATFNSYIKIFNLAIAEFRELTRIDNVVFLSELNFRAQRLFYDNTVAVPVPEIYYRIATRLHHYLIDEFQDTSKLQWSNIFPLVDEALSSAGSLFYVGDKKQAIFGFRGGDISLFDSIGKHFARLKQKTKSLKINYRSQKEIVKFNNEIFAPNNLERFVKEVAKLQKDNFDKDLPKILDVFKDSEEEPTEEHQYGYVNVEAVETPGVDERNVIIREKVIPLIKELKQRFNYEDITILARKNKDVELFTSWLIEEDIPVESERTVNIREHPLIKELISFLKFLDSPIDNLSFASFVLGDIFQKASGIKQDVMRDFLFRHHQDKNKKQKNVYLYREFRNSFPDAWNNLIDEFFRRVGFASLYEFVISIFSKFKIMENFPGQQGFLMHFLEFIKEKEEDYSGLSSFLELFEEVEEKELFVNLTRSDSVRIMTVHKSKGLEFPVVIIPFLEMNAGVGSGVSATRKPYILQQSKNRDLRLIRLKKEYGLFSEKLGEEYKNEYMKSLINELDTLYVALTRAKDELYIFIPSKVSGKHNLAGNFIPYKTVERGTKKKYAKKQSDKEEIPSVLLPVSNYSDWLGILKDEFISPLQLLHRDNLIKGNIMHFLLSCIGNLTIEDKDKSLSIARERAKTKFLQEKNLDRYLSTVRKLIADKKFRQFFYIEDGRVYQEKDICDFYGNRKVIDRLIITSKDAWIIDYKSSRDEFGAQKQQITGYMEIIKSLYPKLKVKGFLIYLDDLTTEEIQWKE